MEPEDVLKRRMVKRGNRTVTQVLIKWKGKDVTDTTWEDFQLLKERFPRFNLAGEVASQGEGPCLGP